MNDCHGSSFSAHSAIDLCRSESTAGGEALLLKSGTIVDATIIAAPSSTKNAQEVRDPEMKQTRKGKQWHFGMKAHVIAIRRFAERSATVGAGRNRA
jgi:hypothetical protein